MIHLRISIVIPTFNRAKTLRNLLQSITEQENIDFDFEAIILDNGSTDDTKEIYLEFKDYKYFKYHYNSEPGLLTGRHYGLEMSNGEIIAFFDDDIMLNSTYLSSLNTLFSDPSIHLATGPCLPNYIAAQPDWLSYFWDKTDDGIFCTWLSLLDLGNSTIQIDPNFVWGLNFCMRRSKIIELGGFHPDYFPEKYQMFQGDGETGLTMKAKKLGYKAIYYPGLLVHHEVSENRMTLAYFKKRAFIQGMCNSFSDLREGNIRTPNKITLTKKLRNYLHPYYRWLKFEAKGENTLPDEIRKIFDTLTDSEKEGYDFHQHAFNTNENVRHWVQKENYWDYKLPIL